MKPIQFTFLFLLLSHLTNFAQSNILAGGVHIEQIGGCTSNQVRLEVFVYSTTAENDFARDTIQVEWGDGTMGNIARLNAPGNMPGTVIRNDYRSEHTYAGPGMYSIRVNDCCLAQGFVNVPNSGSVAFQSRLDFQLYNGQFQGCNTTPQLLQPLVDFGVVKIPFFFNAGAFDSDGDSLSFHIADPLPELNYDFPDAVLPGPNNQFSIDEKTGIITWNTPQKEGKYLVGLQINEHRFGEIIGESIFWLTIDVKDYDIAILPNPVSSILTIQAVSEVGNENFNLMIHNVLGQLIFRESGALSNGKHAIDVSDFANGTYFLSFEAFGRQWTKKFIKT